MTGGGYRPYAAGLKEFVIQGIKTTIPLTSALCAMPSSSGGFSTRFLENLQNIK